MTKQDMQPETLLVDDVFLLEKFPGKGGWTYALIPNIHPPQDTPFGWVRVKGFIDHVYIEKTHLMPTKNKQLFVSVKAAIRKQIGKEAGSTVHITLYADKHANISLADLLECFALTPNAQEAYQSLPPEEQARILSHINEAATEELKVKRINEYTAKLAN